MTITWKVLMAVAQQLKKECTGEYVQKVQQIAPNDIVIKFRRQSIFISCNPNFPRIHLTHKTFESPYIAYNFCMLLRKYLSNGKLIDVSQPENERVLILTFLARNELGDIAEKKIIAEIMGRNSNIILADHDNKILGSARIGSDLTSIRPIIKGINYELPPKSDKIYECEDVSSPNISEEIENSFAAQQNKQQKQQLTNDIVTEVFKKLDIAKNKITKLNKELEDAVKREKHKLYGELLTANIYRLEQGEKAEVENYYTGEKIIIPLDKSLTIAQNAAKNYKKYEKKRRAETEITNQINKTQMDINYYESVVLSLETAETKEDFEQIRQELNLTKNNKQNNKNNKITIKQKPTININGFDIYVGKNNTQNDYLSLKFAQNLDLWLHVQKMAGSHVIIRTGGRTVPQNVLETAAKLAKENSKAKNEKKVAIDYCPAKFVKKPKGAKAGFVIYSNFKSIII